MSTLTYWVASLGNPERKTLLAFLIQQNDLLGVLAGVKFLLKKERVFFFRGSALDYSGSVAGRNTVLRRRGLGSGEESARGFSISFFGGHKNRRHITLKSRQSRDTKFVLCLTHPPVRAQNHTIFRKNYKMVWFAPTHL